MQSEVKKATVHGQLKLRCYYYYYYHHHHLLYARYLYLYS